MGKGLNRYAKANAGISPCRFLLFPMIYTPSDKMSVKCIYINCNFLLILGPNPDVFHCLGTTITNIFHYSLLIPFFGCRVVSNYGDSTRRLPQCNFQAYERMYIVNTILTEIS